MIAKNKRLNNASISAGVPRFPSYCWLLVAGYVLAPMTAWRIWKVGPGEVLALLGCVGYLHELAKRQGGVGRLKFELNLFSGFWLALLAVSFAGCLWCMCMYPKESSPIQLLTWLYLAFVSLVTYDALQQTENVKSLLILACGISAIWYALLYVYGEAVSTTFYGAQLWFGEHTRYTGGANNPHQLALPMATGAVVLTAGAMEADASIRNRIVCSGLAILCFWLLLETESSTGYMAFFAGLAALLFSRIKDRRIMLILICVTISICFLASDRLLGAFMDWVQSDRNGLDRFRIYETFPTAFDKGPLFGLGPGTHARGGVQEFHNTYLEVLSMGGLVGGIIFFIFSVYCFSRVRNSSVSIAILFALYSFGFAGFAMRRLVYWLLLSFALAYPASQITTNALRDHGRIRGAYS